MIYIGIKHVGGKTPVSDKLEYLIYYNI